jgi:CRP/FNR family cyclic AMP-dependent transcriptional regulator
LKPEMLKQFRLLTEFSEEDREALVDVLEERNLPDGKSAFREGAEGEGLLLLCKGRMTLKSKRTGAILGTVEAPAHLGGASLFAFGRREATAIAEGPVQVAILPRAGLPRLADDAPRAAFRLAEAVAGELAGLVRQSLDVISENAPDE